MYEQVTSCVRGKDGLTEIFPCNRGVRQGCLLSPISFALFLNDLNNHIKMFSDGIMLDDTPVHTLLYADDLVLIGKDKKDLQKQLDALENFTNSLNIEVNLGKTKVMVVQKNKKKSIGKSRKKNVWKLGDKEIEECNLYKYLGVTIKNKRFVF